MENISGSKTGEKAEKSEIFEENHETWGKL